MSVGVPTFIGSFWVGMTLSHSYIATNTSTESRIIRFLILETALFFALATGNLLGGQLLKRHSWIGGSEIRNYSGTFITGSLCAVISILWTVFRIKGDLVVSDDQEKVIEDENVNLRREEKSFFYFLFIDVFNPKRVVDSFKAVFAKRESNIRTQIILLVISHLVIQLEQIGMYKILFNYTQRMYLWNFETFSFVTVIAGITGPIATMAAIPFLSKVIKLTDIEMSLVGTVSLILSTTFAGAILTPLGFYLRIAFGSLSNAANISIRSKMSKIIHTNEATKVFAAMTTIEVTCPFIAAVIYSNVYNATIATYPSLFFQMSTVALLIPFAIFIFMDLKYERTFQ